MAQPSPDVLTKVSTEAAAEFVQSYYPALRSGRQHISTFYAAQPSSIIFNGNEVADGPSVQEIFAKQMPPSHYDVQSYDCQIINPNFPVGDEVGKTVRGNAAQAAKKMSILLTVSGSVRYGEGRESIDSPTRGYSETFVLVPNPQADAGPRGAAKKHWVIQSQNFRLVNVRKLRLYDIYTRFEDDGGFNQDLSFIV